MITFLETKSRSGRSAQSASDKLSPTSTIERTIANCLIRCPYSEVRNVTFSFTEGLVVLEGTLSSFHLKQIAQTIVQQVAGVERVVNSVNVSTDGYFEESSRRGSCR